MLITWQVINYSLIIKYLLHTTDNAVSDFIKVTAFYYQKTTFDTENVVLLSQYNDNDNFPS